MARRKVYYTSKGQPYVKLPSGRAKFISKRSAGVSGTGDLGRRKRRIRLEDVAEVSLGELGKLVRAAGKCITIITSRGAQSFCPSGVSISKRGKKRKKA